MRLARDALGRLARVGESVVDGWDGLYAVDGHPRIHLPGIAHAEAGGGALLDPRGTPVLAVRGGALDLAPTGLAASAAAGEAGAAGRYLPFAGGPLLSLVDAVDPLSGQGTGPTLDWPWTARRWEPAPGPSPWAAPDDAADVPWDPAGWAPSSPWADPLALLVAIGELPDGGPRAARAPGVPWLPTSFAPRLPAPVPDGLAGPLDTPFEDEPLVVWVVEHATAPTRAAAPGDLAACLLAPALGDRLRVPPGLQPLLPAALREP
jgi:hypothetical protein